MEKDKIMLEDYYQLDNSYYHKRLDDDLYAAKWGMVIEFLDLNDPNLKPFDGVNFALIGFKSDKGVYINHGRVGGCRRATSYPNSASQTSLASGQKRPRL